MRERVLERLPELARDDFLVGMVAQHELQHGETMAQTLALAGLPAPRRGFPEVEASGDVLVPGGPFALGSDEPLGLRQRAAGRTTSSCRPSGSTALS